MTWWQFLLVGYSIPALIIFFSFLLKWLDIDFNKPKIEKQQLNKGDDFLISLLAALAIVLILVLENDVR